jgi:hypothetical protein
MHDNGAAFDVLRRRGYAGERLQTAAIKDIEQLRLQHKQCVDTIKRNKRKEFKKADPYA